MRLAVVVPPGAQAALPEGLEAYFAFAPNLLSDFAYNAFFMGRPNLLIDCPIYEGFEELSFDPHRWAAFADLFRPAFLIIPDIRGDARGTIAKAQPYLARSASACATGVIQGETLEDCIWCAKEFWKEGVRRFALPKDLSWRTEFRRSDILLRLQDTIGAAPVHLLGADWPYSDEIRISRTREIKDQVKSVDTAEPANAAMGGHRLAPRQPSKRPDNWTDLGPALMEHQQTFHSNISWLRRKLNGII